MKKSTLFSFLFAAVVLICSQGCDPSSQYPISYKIDGSPWYAESAPCLLTGLNNISINATPTVQNQKLTIFYFTQYSVGTHSIDNVNNFFTYDNDGDTTNGGYWAKSHNPATVSISEFNTGTKKIVGTFSGKLYNIDNTDSILITDGRFDLHYQQ
jgi:hypothetical protein